jgi:3D (Asp-Asp-Asp) domain-containing protein
MRIVSMIVALFGLSTILLAEKASADTINTNIKNEIAVETKKYDIKNDPFLISMTFESSEEKAPEEQTKTAEQIRYEEILNKWKLKQQERWANLPQGKFTINASAYTAAADECGKSDGITASGIKVQENRTLACPPQYPFGAKVSIEGYGVYTCEDRGGAIKGNKFDIYMETKAEAFQFGRRNLLAEIVQ